MKPIKIGGSYYIILPNEYIKVFDLDKYNYTLEVNEKGNTITFKKAELIEVKGGNN